ncbi:ParB/RepB/Spo0J family partition protein [Wenyingzhuangia sp. 2_MG-2023]|uniref:ParB/RepB/Spo0J family partition protein n=1 Tax=Wenyingzhuangia sp. 2_MG-2023 TaxID=3062639 RepID=UPI0026E1A899|nr:ParB/RepB/Spo0J family partition protein [Wenyingzhuangia sp. 2_MG-2023]MDO6737851.1 ParB/RepB/Spo0J family partition protein [Wenyingzhuangia sp. 2_MG-2023]
MAKATKKQALGRGLSALLKENDMSVRSANHEKATEIVGNIIELSLEQIEVNPFQPRTHFDEEALKELADSIKVLGVIQPITVRRVDDKFQLVSGERRFRASKLIGNTTIPAYIRLANDQEMLEMALVENIQRKNLDPIEVALSYQRLIDEINLTQEELGERVGKKRSTITNYLRLLKLDPIIQIGMRDGFLSMGHGRAIINIDDNAKQLEIYEKILKDGLSVRQTEALVAEMKREKSPKPVPVTPSFVKNNEQVFNRFFGQKVAITSNDKGKGKISISFNSEEEFNQIKTILNLGE